MANRSITASTVASLTKEESYGFVGQVANPARKISCLSNEGCHVGVLRVIERGFSLWFQVR